MGNPAASQFKPGQNSPEIATKWNQALELRKAGVSYQQIADKLGYADPSGAYQAVQSALKATLAEPAADVRKMEVERLDRLMLGVWQRAIGGDAEALGSVLRIMNHRAALLGLLAPTKHAATNPEGTAEAKAGELTAEAAGRIGAILALAMQRRDGNGTAPIDPEGSPPDEPG